MGVLFDVNAFWTQLILHIIEALYYKKFDFDINSHIHSLNTCAQIMAKSHMGINVYYTSIHYKLLHPAWNFKAHL